MAAVRSRLRGCGPTVSAPGLPGWTASGKAVFEVEYKSSSFNCTKSNGWNFNAILKTVDLFDTPWTPCR